MNILRSIFPKMQEARCEMTSAASIEPDEAVRLRQCLADLGPWFHNYEIAKGVWTNPEGDGPGVYYPARRWTIVKPWFEDLQGKSVLDIGCSSGFFSLKAAELGAAPVLGVDSGEQLRAIEQARFAAVSLGLQADFQTVSVYDLAKLGRTFDVVVFMGVFYHLRHPLLALEALRKVCTGTLILQTNTVPSAGRINELPGASGDLRLNSDLMLDRRFPSTQFVEGTIGGDDSCWFIPNVEAVAAMLRSCGFRPKDFVFPDGQEVLVRCTVD